MKQTKQVVFNLVAKKGFCQKCFVFAFEVFQKDSPHHPCEAFLPPSNQQTSRLRTRRIVQGTVQHDRALPLSPIVLSCVVSVSPRRFDNVFGMRRFYDIAGIFYRPIHNEVVLPFECVPSVPPSEAVFTVPHGFNLHLLFHIFIPSS